MLCKNRIKQLIIPGWLLLAACSLTVVLAVTASAGNGRDGVNPGQADNGAINHDQAEPSLPYAPNQVIVMLPPEVDPSELDGVVLGSLDHAPIYLFEMESGWDAESAAAHYDSMSVVVWAHPNYLLNSLHPVQGSYPFSDEHYDGDYLLQYAATMLDLESSHQIATGDGVTVGVIDGGIDASYDIFDGVVQPGYDFVDDDGEPGDEPGGNASGHGTFVAGVLHLIAPDAQIRPYRIFDPAGAGDGFSLALAIEKAVDDGCQILNLSLVLAHQHLAVQEAINYAESQGVTVVVAAGNESTEEPVFPAWYDNVIAVAAVDSASRLTSFSNYGPHIDVCAPGFGVYSAYQNSYYAWWSGSSFAAPCVSGQAALLKEASPTANGELIRLAIVQSAINIDDINPNETGMLGGGLANPIGSIDEIENMFTAQVTPDTLFFDLEQGIFYFISPSQTFVLTSTNAPAGYTAEVIYDGAVYSYVDTSAGTTNDTNRVSIDPYSPPLGTHYDEVQFIVEGVPDPVSLVVSITMHELGYSDSAWFDPNYVLIETPLGSEVLQYGTSMLFASNAPAAFTASLLPGGDQFTTILTSSGVADDSVVISVDPTLLGGPGIYHDTVACTVEGIDEPVLLGVLLGITDTLAPNTCSVTPMFQAFYTDDGVDSLQYGTVFVSSTNAPATYNVSLVGTADFIRLLDTVGQTNDSLEFEVFGDASMPPGIYIDSMMIDVEDCTNSPRLAVVYLQVGDVGPTGDTCWVYPGFQALYAPEGVNYVQYGSVFVGSNNAPQNYSVSVVGVADFISLPTTSGQTDDSLVFEAISDSSMPAGIYTDTLRFDVDSVDNSPRYAVVYLQVGDVGPTGDTCWVYPGFQAFYAPGGVDYLQYGSVFIGSNNAPQAYSVRVLDYPDFTVLPFTEGVTSDSLVFEVVSRNFANPGIYTDTLEITVDSVDNSPKLAVLYLQIHEPNSDSLWLIPDSLSFSIPEGSTDLEYGYSMLWSKYNQKTYTAFIDTTQTWLSLAASSGLTQDTVGVIVDPTGLPAGDYTEIVWYLAEDISDDAYLHVHLTVTSGPVEDSVFLAPDTLLFHAEEGSEALQAGYSWLSSVNAPANYGAIRDTDSFFLTLLDTMGVTDDSVGVMVDPSGLPAGVYGGYAMYFVDGISQPGYLTVFLVIDSVITPPSDSAWVLPDPLTFQAPHGSSSLMIDTAILFSSNQPAPWGGFVLGGAGSFMTLQDTFGLTNDSIIVWVDPTGLAPGWYGDTIVVDVSGIGQSVLLTVMLNVYTTDSVSGVQNFPNPFNPTTEIRFHLPAASHVRLRVYNIVGQAVATLTDQRYEAGEHAVEFDGTKAASGVYFYRLETEATTITRKMILLK